MSAQPSNVTLLPSAVRAATQTLVATANQGWGAAIFYLTTTVGAAAETLQLVIDAQDPASLAFVVWATFPVTAAAFVGTKAYHLSSGAIETVAATDVEVQALALPGRFRVRLVHSAAGSWTYSLGASYLV